MEMAWWCLGVGAVGGVMLLAVRGVGMVAVRVVDRRMRKRDRGGPWL